MAGRCPFGFTADDEQEEDETLSEGEILGKSGLNKNAEKKGKHSDKAEGSGKKSKIKVPTKFDMDADPVSWFYQNQIKSEEEFQAKKEALRAEARKRLDQIMDKKSQRLMWPSDSEFDDMSLSSGELSELDSDVHSLASVRTCAYSWIAKANYHMPAEATMKVVAFLSLTLALASAYVSFKAIGVVKPVLAVVTSGDWATYSLLVAMLMGGSASLSLLSANWRSRKMMLAAQISTMITYGAATVVTALIWAAPTEVDARIQSAMCTRWGDKQTSMKPPSSPMCDKLPSIQALVSKTSTGLQYWMMAQAIACLVLCCVGLWYVLELCFIEKKGVKHVRRHKRNRFTIPWDKIKIVGQPLPCGQGQKKKGGGGGTCPVGFTSKDKKA